MRSAESPTAVEADRSAPPVRLEVVGDRGGRERFIRLPWSLYADDPNWVAPLLAERRRFLDPRANPYFNRASVCLWLAYRGTRPVGRISAQVDHAHLRRHRDATGHFGLLEAEDDPTTFAALLGAAESWLGERDMGRLRGPFSLSINDECGLLVSGFDTPPSLMMGHARPYYSCRLEEQGYAKAKDLLAYDYDTRLPLPPAVRGLVERLRASPRVRLRPLRCSRYRDELRVVVDIFNDAWSENWGFVPLEEADVDHMARTLKPLVRRELVCIAEVDGRPAAMAVALPNLNEAVADLDGALLPTGWVKLLWRLKVRSPGSARVALMGVRRRYRHTPWGAALAYAVIEAIHRNRRRGEFGRAELSWILEDNVPMRRMIEALGARPYKTYRIYEKAIP